MRVCTASAGGFFFLLLTVLVTVAMAEQKKQLMGGMQKVQPVNAEVEGFVKQMRSEAEGAAGGEFKQFIPVEFATQLVNGVNYFVKVDVGDGQFVHIRFYRPFKGETQFVKLVGDKTEKDPLEYIPQ
ncbi:cystatin-A-like [Diadema antillarum]|uniref:cystatin-A-like n=1 Tax=Diadema antillarum TaxID=105358 RepID=UPI003A89E784